MATDKACKLDKKRQEAITLYDSAMKYLEGGFEKEAIKYFSQVIKSYPDIIDVIRQAKERLESLK